MPLQSARSHLRARQRLILATVALVRREWARMGEDFDESWALIAPRVTQLTAAAQLGAARTGATFVPEALAQQGQKVSAVAEVDPRGLVGVASDGRPLESLLYGAVARARKIEASTTIQRLESGGKWLEQIVQTQISDAARDAAKIAIVARPGVKWVRMVNPPCCQRCAVLTSDAVLYSRPFERHPGCDCSMIPTTVANPDWAGDKLTAADVTDLTQKQKDALADGANFHATINDYQRKRGDYSGYLPPTRVDKVIDRAGQREKAAAALAKIGVLIP